MKKFRYFLGGMLVFLCLFGSCSGGDTPKDFLETEETTKKEKEDETASEKEVLSEEENPVGTEDEQQEDPEDAPPIPEYLSFKIESETEIIFEFSHPVKITSMEFIPTQVIEEIENGSEVKVKLAENPGPGVLITANFQAEDEFDNSISKQVTFYTRNDRVPKLQINELRTENDNPKAEFIEFKMLSSGNLGALRVFAASNSKVPLIYEFKPVEVAEGEYVVLHLRTYEGSCKDEYDSLDESGGKDSCPTARDFWIPGSNKLLRKTDAVYVLDQDDKVLDAIMMSENSSSEWSNKNIAAAAELLFEQGSWKSPAGKICSPAEAVDTSVYKTAATLSISRKDVPNTHTAADWYVTATGNATPGLPNK